MAEQVEKNLTSDDTEIVTTNEKHNGIPGISFCLGIFLELSLGLVGIIWAIWGNNDDLLKRFFPDAFIRDLFLGITLGCSAAVLIWLMVRCLPSA